MGGHEDAKKREICGQNSIFIEFEYIEITLHLFIGDQQKHPRK